MTGIEVQVARDTAVPLLKWTATKWHAGRLDRHDRRIVSQAIQELLSPSPNLSRVEDLLSRVSGTPDGLAYVRHHLEEAKQSRQKDRVRTVKAKRLRKSRKVK